MNQPTVSVIVLTYERKKLLEDCLHSLLAQTYPRDKLEIVVSDDGSRDGTRELVERMQATHPHLKYVHQPHRGIPAARNNGIRNATGDIVAIVADDYILNPSYVSTIVEFFDQRPEAQVVRFKIVAAGKDLGSRISHFYFDVSVRRRLEPDPPPPAEGWRARLARAWRKPPRFEETITTRHQLEAAGAAAFRREVFAAVGSFDESLQRAEDTDMTMRLRALGIAVYYYPFQQIRHQYDPLMLDTVTKCFLTGLNRCRLYQKHALLPGHRSAVRTLVSQEVGAILSALWRARQAGSIPKLLCYLPFMLLFETATGLGFFVGVVSRRSLPTARPE
jgi:glycosyltransferase involved in cell wall biosynthesis